MFCQSAVEATVCVFLPAGTKAKDVSVELLPGAEATASAGAVVTTPTLIVGLRTLSTSAGVSAASLSSSTSVGPSSSAAFPVLFQRTFAYDVVISRKRTAIERLHDSRGRDYGDKPDDVDVDDFDYELLDFEAQRIVRITVTKKPPQGLQVWWSKAFVGDVDSVDVTAIPERLTGSASARSAVTMKQVWEQAHAQFKHNIATNERWKPQFIDVDDTSGDRDD